VSARAEPSPFPPGLNNAYWFALFNALSFQVVLGSPMVLYGKSLNASATTLGILAGMMPLLVVFQIPAARYVERVGYKRFVYAGWGTRVAFIFGVALVPLTGGFLDQSTRLVLLLALLFGFNLSRGISSAAWLPWITSLVPEMVRGRYLARDAACVNLAGFASFLLAAVGLGREPQAWQFAALFAFSAVMGATSLSFLKRIPETAAPGETRDSGGSVPWGAMLRFAPFHKLLRTVLAWSVAHGGVTTFAVVFLKTETTMTEAAILLVSSASFLGGLSSLWLLGSRLDGLGSKPVLGFSFALWMAVLAGWVALSGGRLQSSVAVLVLLQFGMGLLGAMVNMANTRLVMAVVPAMGRNHFFALFSVVGSAALGLAPIGWGLLIDAIGAWQGHWLGLEWNRYTIFFAAVMVVMALALAFSRRLEEPRAAGLDQLLREMLIDSPQRVLVRLWTRE
jgi:MFS family permease